MKSVLHKITCVILTAVMMMSIPLTAYATEDTAADTAAEADTDAVQAPAEFRAVWFSFRDWQTYLKGKNEADFTSAFNSVCQKAKDNGLNTIIIHVRSHNDAVYPSSCYPWSDQMTGGNPGYDPLSIITSKAHENGLQIHAWINPYGYRNGKYCGDKSLATADNIIAGIKEILGNYPVDGIHFDDYFPPLGASVHNALLKRAYETTHAYGKVFGVSPGGNIDNNRNAGIDIDTWLSTPGYIDYICPQIYWSNKYGKNGDVTMFSDRLDAWRGLNKAGIKMYVGLAAYRVGESSKSDKGWSSQNNNLSSQVTELRNKGCGGYVLFSYSSIAGSACATEMKNLKAINN